MSRAHDPFLYTAWPALAYARQAGDLDECVRLRRAEWDLDASKDQAEREERAWHAKHTTQETTTVDTNPKTARAIADGKLRLELLETAMTHPAARVAAHGADKYGVRNWRVHPIYARTYIAALRRHIDEWADGVDADHDSGEHPLAHMVANCNVILDAIAFGTFVDNRDFAEAKAAGVAANVPTGAKPDAEPVGAGVSKPQPICVFGGEPCPVPGGCRIPCKGDE